MFYTMKYVNYIKYNIYNTFIMIEKKWLNLNTRFIIIIIYCVYYSKLIVPKDIFDTSNALLIGLNNWALKAENFQARWTFHSFRLWLKAAFCDKMHFRKLRQIRYAASRRKSINMQWLVEHGITRKNICIEHSKMRKEKKNECSLLWSEPC